MLAIWNRRELVTVLTMQEQSDILSALRDAGLDYAVKVIDRSSPSVLNPGTRADFGTMGMSPGAQYEYIIYVNKRDYDAARDAAGLPRHSLNQKRSPARAFARAGLFGRREGSFPTQTADAGVARGPRFS